MDVIVGGRGSGKTYRLVEWYKASPSDRRIITRDSRSRKDLAIQYSIPAQHIFTLSNLDLIRGYSGSFGLDVDVDWLIRELLNLGPHQGLGPVTINGVAMVLSRPDQANLFA